MALSVFVGQLIADHPSVISIEFRDKAIRMSLLFFISLVYLGLLVIHLTFEVVKKLVTFPSFLRHTRKKKRRDRFLDHLWLGFVSLVKGDYLNAKTIFLEGKDNEHRPEVSVLAAAFAANCSGAKAERDALLNQAKTDYPHFSDFSDFCRAWMAMDSGDLEVARGLLE